MSVVQEDSFFLPFLLAERFEARLAVTTKQVEQHLHYLPAFKILPEDSPDYLKFERKLKALKKQKECLERLISK